MAAPSPTARVAPTGAYLTEGWESHITFSSASGLDIWEKEVAPPSYAGGTPKIITNQFSGRLVQKAPASSIEAKDSVIVAHYDPEVIPTLKAMLLVRQTITTEYPNGATIAEYGFINELNFSPLVKGTEPTVSITIVYTQTDPATCDAAEGFFTAGTGTASVC